MTSRIFAACCATNIKSRHGRSQATRTENAQHDCGNLAGRSSHERRPWRSHRRFDLADLSVHFQRVLTFSEHATIRSRYDAELTAIMENFTLKIVVPLKQSRGRPIPLMQGPPAGLSNVNSVFVGQSFHSDDKRVNQLVHDVLGALGLRVVTGEKPKADQISHKVKQLIEEQPVFIGIFTRRDKIARKKEWTTSPWVIDEKAYAVARKRD